MGSHQPSRADSTFPQHADDSSSVLSSQSSSPASALTSSLESFKLPVFALSTDAPRPEQLDLTPCTWDSLPETDFPPDERFEVVDGILVWQPIMPHGHRLHQKVIIALVGALHAALHVYTATSCLDTEVSSLDDSSTYQGDSVNMCIPDIFLTALKSESSSSLPQKSRKCVAAKLNECNAVFEVTSPGTRHKDLDVKWHRMLCNHRPCSSFRRPTACVIVGSLHPFDNAVRSHDGRPDSSIPSGL